MIVRHTDLPNGLTIVEFEADPVPNQPPTPPKPECHKCRTCGKDSPFDADDFLGGFFRIHEGERWLSEWPTCGHGRYLECPTCQSEPEPPLGPGGKLTPEREAYFSVRNCPVCGCWEFFT